MNATRRRGAVPRRARPREKDSDPQTIRTTWRLQAQDMPFATIRFPVLVGIAQTKGPTFGQDAVFTVGPAFALSFRKAFLSWPGKYVSVEPYVHVARRIGDSLKRADGTDEVPATLWGGGFNVNLSGYVSLGLSYLGDFRFTRPGVFFMLEPAPWLSKALGLEKKLE